MAGKILNVLEAAVNFALLLLFLVVGAYAAFALWDNYRIYSAAEGVRDDLLRLKPVVSEDAGDEGVSFEELLAINPDVCAWLTLDGTEIDFAVVQGETNLEYINTDVYGNYALAGSIFLDTRNSADFSDPYSLLYGHHMENSGMFGDLDLYKEEDFFWQNKTGTLILPGGSCNLEIFAVLIAASNDKAIFEPDVYRNGITALFDYVEENAMYLRREVLEELQEAENPQVLCMTTCSSEYTNARTAVLAGILL